MSRKIFFDGGANKGQSMEAFIREWPDSEDFEIYCFEPDQYGAGTISNTAMVKYQKQNVNIHQQAVWVNDGKIDFFIKGPASEGNTVLQEKVDKESKKFVKKTVNCIDVSRWIKENVNPEDFFIMKLDIEGAEYEVVEHLKQTQVIPLIDIFFLEIHGLKCNKDYQESLNIVKTIQDHGLNAYSWSAETFKYNTYKENVYDEKRLKKDYKKWESRGLSITKKGEMK